MEKNSILKSIIIVLVFILLINSNEVYAEKHRSYKVRKKTKLEKTSLAIEDRNITKSNMTKKNHITIEEVISSTKKHYPKIHEVEHEIEVASGELMEAKGEFDINLKHSTRKRSGDYYDGKYSKTVIEKKFTFAGMKLYGGQMHSSGAVPIYEYENVTKQDGASIFGGEISLLKGLVINDDQLKLDNLDLAIQIAKAEAELIKINTVIDAQSAYFEAIGAHKMLEVAKQLARIATERQEKIEISVQKGSMAQINAEQNKMYVLKRNSELAERESYLIQKINKLRMYLRDDKGDMKRVGMDEIPNNIETNIIKNKFDKTQDYAWVKQTRPEFGILIAKAEALSNKYKIAMSKILPDLTINFEKRTNKGAQTIQNYLANPQNRSDYAQVNISIPLQFREGRGAIAKADAEIRILERKKKLFEDTMSNDLDNIYAGINALSTKVANLNKEVDIASNLIKLENERYIKGGGDFFMINIREDMFNEAKMRQIESQVNYSTAQAYYYCLINWDKCT